MSKRKRDKNVTVLHAVAPLDPSARQDQEPEATLIPEFCRPYYLLSERFFNSLPVFSVKSSKGQQGAIHKTVVRQWKVDGEPVSVQVTISCDEGLPNTVDLELFRALEQMFTEEIERTGDLPEKFLFKGSELLRKAGKASSGPSYKELNRFLLRLRALNIKITQDWDDASHSRQEAFGIIDHLIQEGQHFPDGSVASLHAIKLAGWYLHSLKHGNCWVVDHTLFQQLTKPTAQTIHQLLHGLFHLGQGIARHRYSELANNYQLTRKTQLSKIREQLDPAHRELANVGFLEKWSYDDTVDDGKDVEIRWEAGPAWWKVHEEMHKQGLPMETPEQVRDPFIPLRKTQLSLLENRHDRIKALVTDILEFLGPRDRQYTPFFTRAAQDLSEHVVRKVLGDVRERVMHGRRSTRKQDQVANKGAYLISLLKIEGRKAGLSWALKDGG